MTKSRRVDFRGRDIDIFDLIGAYQRGKIAHIIGSTDHVVSLARSTISNRRNYSSSA